MDDTRANRFVLQEIQVLGPLIQGTSGRRGTGVSREGKGECLHIKQGVAMHWHPRSRWYFNGVCNVITRCTDDDAVSLLAKHAWHCREEDGTLPNWRTMEEPLHPSSGFWEHARNSKCCAGVLQWTILPELCSGMADYSQWGACLSRLPEGIIQGVELEEVLGKGITWLRVSRLGGWWDVPGVIFNVIIKVTSWNSSPVGSLLHNLFTWTIIDVDPPPPPPFSPWPNPSHVKCPTASGTPKYPPDIWI